MLKQYSQQHIRFARIEKRDAWLIVAVLLEIRDGEAVAISKPRIVKIIPKTTPLALAGSTSAPFVLSGAKEERVPVPIPSPYFPATFGYVNSSFSLIGLAPQPPTVK